MERGKLFWTYLRQNRKVLLGAVLFCGIFTATFWLYRLPVAAVLYPALLCLFLGGVWFIVDFLRTLRRHRQLVELKALTAGMIDALPEAERIEEADYQAIIKALQAELAELDTAASARYRDMMEYYTLWVHQIKTPISAMRLTLQNEDTPLSRRLSSDLFRIEQYVEMVLAFLRLDAPSGDYVFREHDIDPIVRQAAAKFAGEFIDRKLRFTFEPTGQRVVTDEKWFSFVLEQLLSNALKYTREGGIKIYLEEPKTLCIADTGIGIAPEDLPRIFEKGYTGYNGRRDKKASGIGLYLCRRICQNLGVRISVTSELDKGTVVRIDLGQYDLKKE